MTGESFGQYLVEETIGSGGMGVVYRARDTRLDRTVALKVLRHRADADDASRERVLREGRLASALNHPHICTIYEVGEVQGELYIAMEYVDGERLSELIPGRGLPPEKTVAYGQQIAAALAHAHEHGIAHLDLKAANIVVTRDGRVKVLDFGLARRLSDAAPTEATATLRVTGEGTVAGTLPYMAPEVLRGQPGDGRSDVWALGVLLYEMAAGHTPFSGRTGYESTAATLYASPAPLPAGVPTGLRTIVRRALSKEPGERYQNGGEIQAALEACHAQRSGPAVFRRWRPALGGAAALALALAGYLAVDRPGSRTAETTGRLTVAVLPFHALAPSPGAEFLSIGIPDAIITRLANLTQIRPRPTSAILQYEKQTADPQQAGRALGAEYVLTGSFRQIGEELRVTVQLVRVQDGEPLWGRAYNLPRRDLLRLEDNIATRVSEALKIRVTSSERERTYRRYTENAKAYELYLEGRSYLVRNRREDTLAAVTAFERAQALDPGYALAHAGLATASAQMRLFFANEPDVIAWEERAKAEARRALDLGPGLAEAHEAAAAVFRSTEFDWHQTIAEGRRALDLNPNLDLPHLYRASAFSHLGLLDEVGVETDAAMDINPSNRVEPLRVQGVTALFAGRFAEAGDLLEQARRSSDGLAADWNLAQALYYAGERGRAEAILANLRGSARSERRAQATLASYLAARGESAQAAALLGAVMGGTYMDHHVAYSVGAAYAQLNRRKEAIDWLQRAARTGFPCHPWYVNDPLLQPLRGELAFRALVGELRREWEAARSRYQHEGS